MTPGLFAMAGPLRRAGNGWPRQFLPIAVILILLAATHSASVVAAGAETEMSVMAPLAPRALLLDAAVAGDRICAVGERGHVLFSADNGRSWQQVQVPTRSTLTGVAFHDSRLGWAVGHDGVILRTQDGGKTWTRLRYTPDDDRPLLDVWFRDARHGFAIGAYGLCLRTEDGGDTWQPLQVSEDDWHLHQMALSADGRLYIAAEAGQIYRSDDGGASWITLPSPYAGSFFGVIPLENSSVMIFGLRGHVFRSKDAGASWQKVPTGTVATLADGLRLADGRILLAGLAGTVLMGDAGNTRFTPIPGPGRLGVWSVLAINGQGLVCFGERGATPLALGK